MNRIIAVTSQKGGVGKTTTAVNLAESFARLGHRVLIVDCDPQGGAGGFGKMKSAATKGIIQAMRGECEARETISPLFDEKVFGCAISNRAPADLLAFEALSADGKLSDFIKEISPEFDYLIIDTPVGSSAMIKAVLEAADEMLLTINCRAATVKALPDFIRLAQWLKTEVNPELKLAGIAVAMFRAEDHSEKKILDHFRTKLPRGLFLETAIPFDQNLEMASIRSLPALKVSATADTARAYLDMAVEIKQREGELAEGKAVDIGDLIADEISHRADDEASEETDSDRTNFRNRRAEKILAGMCEQAGLIGAVIADRTGLPLAIHSLESGSADTVAAMAPELGKTLEKAAIYMDQPEANNISIDLGSGDRLFLRSFLIDSVRFYLVGICPQTIDPAGEMALAATRLTEELA